MAALAGQEVDLCDGAGPRRVTVAAACRALNVPTSSFYDWKAGRPPSTRDTADAYALDAIIEIHARSRGTYGVRRVHAELALGGHEHVVSRRRVARLMRAQRLQGVHRRRWRHPGARETATWPDHVNRQFVAEGPNRLWVTDITQHRTSCGWVYCAVVLDVYSRRVVGWSIADHLRTELVVDALEMARMHRKPVGTVVHSDRGTQYTSWLFGNRLREASLLGSMGRVASCYDNALMESFFGSMQIELLDRRDWPDRDTLAKAIFEWIEAWYNPHRRHSALGYLSPVEYEHLHTAACTAA